MWGKRVRLNQRGKRNEKKISSHKRTNQAEWVKANLGLSQESADSCSMHAAVYLMCQKEKVGPYKIIWFHIMQAISRVQQTCWLSQHFETLHSLHNPQMCLERSISSSYSYSSREFLLSWNKNMPGGQQQSSRSISWLRAQTERSESAWSLTRNSKPPFSSINHWIV